LQRTSLRRRSAGRLDDQPEDVHLVRSKAREEVREDPRPVRARSRRWCIRRAVAVTVTAPLSAVVVYSTVAAGGSAHPGTAAVEG